MKTANKDKMTLELYSDKAVIRLTQDTTDVSLYLLPKMAEALGSRLYNWATEERGHLEQSPTPKEPGHE